MSNDTDPPENGGTPCPLVTDEAIEELRAILAAAAPGVWAVRRSGDMLEVVAYPRPGAPTVVAVVGSGPQAERDALAIVRARNAVPKLLAGLAQAREEARRSHVAAQVLTAVYGNGAEEIAVSAQVRHGGEGR